MTFEKVQIKDATLYRGDCEEVFATLTKADAIVTDPPYGIGADASMAKQSGKIAGHGHRRVAKRSYEATNWDEAPCSDRVISIIRGHSNYQIIFGGNYFTLPPTSCWLVWDKETNGNFADCELAWTNMPKATRRIRWLWNGFARKDAEPRFDHPTQKPLGVMKWCIEQLPEGCHTILDPFMGSGTTGVACAKMGRRFIGIEREPKYFDIACERIAKAYDQPDLFVTPTRRDEPKNGDLFTAA